MSRLAAALRLEARIQARQGLWPVAGIVTVLITGVVLLVGPAAATVVAPLLLVLDTAAFGVLFIAVLILFERTEGGFDALTVSPLRPGEYLAAKVGLLTVLSVVSAVPITVAATRGTGAGLPGSLLAIAAVGLLAAFLLTSSAAMALPCRSLMDFIGGGIWPLLPLLSAPIPHVLGLWTHPLLYAVPSTGAADLIRAGIDPRMPIPPPWKVIAVVGYLLVALLGAAWLARRTWSTDEPGGRAVQPGRTGADRAGADRADAPRETRTRTVARSRLFGTHATLARVDVRTIRRDPMLLAIFVAPVLIAAVLRFAYPFFEVFARETWGLELEPHRALLIVVLVVLHVPSMMGALTAMLIAEDLDERHLLTLRAGPLSMPSYLAYRLGTSMLLSLVVLIAASTVVGPRLFAWSVPLAGVLLLASATGPLATLLVTAFARNRVEALSVLKIVNLVPVGVPVAAWFLDDPFRWLLAPIPYFWVSESAWTASTPGSAHLFAIGAGILTVVIAGLALGYRTTNRLTTPS